MTTRNDIERVLWKACDSFRGKIDSSRYKDYILSMLFVKYLSDVTLERRALYMEQYDGDERRVERAMSRERFSIDRESTFDYLYKNRTDNEIGQKINVALSHIEDHNSGKLRNRQECKADYYLNKDGTYTVFLKIMAPVQPMLELKFVVPDKKTAQNIYKSWELKASELYSAIYDTLVD